MSHTYLVQYGKPGFVGRFRSADRHARGDRVVVAGPRGTEPGTVLCEPADRFTASDDGDLLREGEPADERAAADRDAHGHAVLLAAQSGTDERGLPLGFIDVEVMLDGAVILHAVSWAECDASPLFEELSAHFRCAIRLLDLSRSPTASDPPEPATSCGKPGCGSGPGAVRRAGPAAGVRPAPAPAAR